MATERNVVDFKIHNLTETQFQELKAQGKIDPNAVYCTPDESLKTDQITNCITEIPQDIKLELSNGVLTLKAGSTYYTPNGEDTYTKTTTTADKTLTASNNGQWAVFINQGGNLQVWNVSALYSGTTAPSGVSYPMWWDTTNNIIKISNDSGTTWVQQFSLPLCVITVSNGAISSVDEVFNGFGYMGSTEFVLPGMDGLSSYGFNDDGTYKNLPMRTSQVRTLTVSGNRSIKIAITTDGYPVWYSASAVRYDKESNRVLYTGSPRSTIIAGEFDVVNGRIQNFKPYKTFRAVDYSDTEFITHQAMPSDRYVDLTLPASGGTITAPADGHVTLTKTAGASGEYAYMRNTANGVNSGIMATGALNCRIFIPVSAGHAVSINYTLSGSTSDFRFVYANGSK